MNRLKTKLFIAATLFSVIGVSQANGNDYLRIKSDALRIERKANAISRETKHYRATPQYYDLVCDVNEFIRLSQHITDLVANGGSIGHIRADVNQLNRTFRHVEGLFDTIEYNIANGIGVKKGNTAHVKRLLNTIEDCIHNMQDDIAVLQLRARRNAVHRTKVVTQRPVAVAPRVPTYDRPAKNYYRGPSKSYYRPAPRPSYRSAGPGLTIGGGSSRINIRF